MSREMIDKMRAKQGLKPPAETPKAQPAPKPVKVSKPEPAPVPGSGTTITLKCGCTKELNTAKVKPEHLAGFLAKRAGKMCPQCRAIADAKERAARPPKKPKQLNVLKGRLPDGAHFDAVYNAKEVMWTATLTLPIATETGEGVEEKTFRVRAGGVFGCLRFLDNQYRFFLEEQEKRCAKTANATQTAS